MSSKSKEEIKEEVKEEVKDDEKNNNNKDFDSIMKRLSPFNSKIRDDQSLYILGAAFGLADVTVTVRSLVENNQLSVTANDATFGESWKGVQKSLVVVYKYGMNATTAGVAYVKELDNLQITPTSTWTQHPFNVTLQTLTIFGAVFGAADVTDTAISKISNNGFVQVANDATWGDSWKGVTKSLVVVYTYDGIPWVNVVAEGVTMTMVDSPALAVLGATWGPLDVLDIVSQYNTNRALRITASNDTIGTDPFFGNKKTLVIVYQYYGYLPNYKLAIEGSILYISFNASNETPGTIPSMDPNVLSIAKAVYGLGDVTSVVQKNITDNTINVTANNATFTDTWRTYTKVLTVVYNYGSRVYQTASAAESTDLSIQFPQAKTNIFYDATDFLENNDKFNLEIFGLYVTVNASNQLTLTQNSSNASSIKAQVNNNITSFQIGSSYVAVDSSSQQLYITSDSSKASPITFQFDQAGGIHFVINGYAVTAANGPDLKTFYLQANTTLQEAYPSGLSNFDVKFTSVAPTVYHRLARSDIKFTDCETKWASFIWQLTGGFVAALGLIPFMTSGEVRTGVLAIIQSNPRAWSYVQRLLEVASNNRTILIWGGATTITVSGFLTLLYDEGLLWKIFKLILNFASWWFVAKVIAKLIAYIFATGVEAAVLIASFVVWVMQVVESGLDVGSCSSNSAYASMQKKIALIVI